MSDSSPMTTAVPSTATVLRALFWKDWRQHRVVLVGVATLGAVPILLSMLHRARSQGGLAGSEQLLEALILGGAWATMLSLFSFAIIGGVSFASERADRSAEFIRLLVPSRTRLLASKVIFAVFALGLALSLGLGLFVGSGLLLDARHQGSNDDVWMMSKTIGGLGMLAFGSAWALSARLASAPISCAGGIGITAVTGALIVSGGSFIDTASETTTTLVASLCAGLGAVCFVVGCITALRRVAP